MRHVILKLTNTITDTYLSITIIISDIGFHIMGAPSNIKKLVIFHIMQERYN